VFIGILLENENTAQPNMQATQLAQVGNQRDLRPSLFRKKSSEQ